MAIILSCPTCHASAKVVNALWGKTIRCRRCNGIIPVSGRTAKSFASSSKEPLDEYTKCPECGKSILVMGGRCPLCDAAILDAYRGLVTTASTSAISPSAPAAGATDPRCSPISSRRSASGSGHSATKIALVVVVAVPVLFSAIVWTVSLSQNHNRQMTLAALGCQIESCIASADNLANRHEFQSAIDMLTAADADVRRVYAPDLEVKISDALQRTENAKRKYARELELADLSERVESAISSAEQSAGKFEFTEAVGVLRKIRAQLGGSRVPELDAKLISALQQMEEAGQDYTAKLAHGYIVVDGELVSPEDQHRKKEQEDRARAEKKRRQEELDRQQAEAARRRREEEAERERQAKFAVIERDKITAFQMSQEFIKETLKAPSSARFPEFSSDDVTVIFDEEEQKYHVSAWVEAQNVFGVYLRKRYVCVLWNSSSTMWRSDLATLLGE